jgi:APA family basic amino acid/polyamine antiporter
MPATSPASRPIGFSTATAIVIGNMIGSGVFLLPAALSAYGGLSLIGWILSAAGSVTLALVFARLARFSPRTGGPYVYTRRAFGDLPGFLVAWSYWISIWAANSAIAVALVGYLDPFVPGLVRQPASAAMLAIAAVWLLTLVNARGVRVAGRVQVVTTLLKILPLVVVGLAGLVVLQPSHFAVPVEAAASPAASVMAVMTLTLWAFLGLESATVPADEVRDPDRTIPRATVVGTVVAAAIYIMSTAGVMGVIEPEALGRSSAPFAEAARALFGGPAAALVALGAAVSCFGALNGWILLAGQLPMGIARDGLFPSVFARMSSRGTPAAGMIIGGILSSLLIASNYARGLVDLFEFIIVLSTLGSLGPYAVCALAGLLGRDGAPRSAARGAGVIVVAGLALLYSLFAIVGAGQDALLRGVLALVAGLPVFVWLRRGSRLTPNAPAAPPVDPAAP